MDDLTPPYSERLPIVHVKFGARELLIRRFME